GAADDLVKATDLARAMVTRFGMSEAIGLSVLEEKELTYLASPQLPRISPYSEETAKSIDHEVKSILEKGLRLALKELNTYRTFIEQGALELIRKETLEEEDVVQLWDQHVQSAKVSA
ncbi:cell division protein FtsH, partial [bacterium]|nr:cell division protein FtsH [bacterium]